MKVFSIIFFMLSAQVTMANSLIMHCDNNDFLVQPIALSLNHNGLSYNSLSIVKDENFPACELTLSQEAKSTFHPTNPESENCSLANLSRSNQQREIISVELLKNTSQGLSGYLKIELDNSFADYGPNSLKSFLYCYQ